MKRLKLISVLILSSFLYGCSFIESFVIINNSDSELVITYQLKEPGEGIPIFQEKPESYGLNKYNGIDWDNKNVISDLDNTSGGVKIKLDTGMALIIGSIINEHYQSYDQEFYNDKVFNLELLEVSYGDVLVSIAPERFDAYFVKTGGEIAYKVDKK